MIHDDSIVHRDATPSIVFPDKIPVVDNKDQRPKWFVPFVITIFLGLTIATGFVLSRKPITRRVDQSQDNHGDTDLDSLLVSCNVEYILFKCAAGMPGLEPVVPPCLEESFQTYRNNWIQNVDPDFDTTNHDLCSIPNKALLVVSYYAQEHLFEDTDLKNIYGLASYYFLLNGEKWPGNKSWLSEKPLREWSGLDFNYLGEVVGISLQKMSIEGEITVLPPFQTLKFLDLSFNRLRGNLPENAGTLQSVDLEYNFLSGTIPLAWTNSTILRRIRVGANNLTGTLSTFIGRMQKLEELSVSFNLLSSSIPSEIGACVSLRELDLRQNRFDGVIPSEIGNLLSLEFFDLGSNPFYEGIVPSELFALTGLESLGLSTSFRMGTIPSALGNLVSLSYLELDANDLHGSLPTELGLLTKMMQMHLGNNRLEGALPSELGRLTKVEVIDVRRNTLNSTLPTELGKLLTLNEFLFSENLFEGYIPYQVCALWERGRIQVLGDVFEYKNCDRITYGGAVCPYPECCRACSSSVP